MANECFEPNTQDVNAEIIDGEAIIINLATGVYYSLENIGAYIWELLAEGHSLEQSVQALVNRYSVSEDDARRDVEELVRQLVEEELISRSEAGPSQSMNGAHGLRPGEDYRKPELNIYRDMGDLLALDPTYTRVNAHALGSRIRRW